MADAHDEVARFGEAQAGAAARTALLKKFMLYGFVWLLAFFVAADIVDAVGFRAVTQDLPLHIEPTFQIAFSYWPIYAYAALAWWAWMRIRKAPLDFQDYTWGLIGTWLLISLSALTIYPLRTTGGAGVGAAAFLLFGLIPAMIYSGVGGAVGIIVHRRTRSMPKATDAHRAGIILLCFGIGAFVLLQVPPSGGEPTWWQAAMLALLGAAAIVTVVGIVAATLRSRAEAPDADEGEGDANVSGRNDPPDTGMR